MAAPVRRTCRRRCMGCDPCWICRFSYPTSFSVSALGGSGVASGVGDDDSGWVGCCGLAGGTYVPATPFGSAEVDNGTTIHRTFRTSLDGWGYYDMGFASGLIGLCSARWKYKLNTFQSGYLPDPFPPYEPVPQYRYAVARCVGNDEESFVWPEIGGLSGVPMTDGEFLRAEFVDWLEIALWVGTDEIAISGSSRATHADATKINVSITERFTGWVREGGTPSVSGYRAALYDILRKERYRCDLAKPCPRTGTFDLDFYSRTLNGVYAFADPPAMYGVTNYNFADFSAPPCVIANAPNYSVSVTI